MRIGIDAGGTKTTGILFDAHHQIVAQAQCGMGNVLVDYEKAFTNIKDCIAQLMAHTTHKVECISVGAAGVSVMSEKLVDALMMTFNTRVIVKTDVEMSHIATFQNADGVLLIAGTGSVVLDKVNGIVTQRGGWGHLLGDEGSAYWIAKQILLTYIQFLETGCMPEGFEQYCTVLNEKYGNRQAIIDLVYRHTKDEVAALAQLIEQFKNSNYTKQLIEKTANHLAQLALGGQKRDSITIAFEGGVITKNDMIFKALCKQLSQEKVRVNIVEKQNGAYGVLYIGLGGK